MRTPLLSIFTIAICFGTAVTQAQQSKPGAGPVILDPPVPVGAEHIVIRTALDYKRVFTYFPSPPTPGTSNIWAMAHAGVYRLEVSLEGKVTAVTILRSLDKAVDPRVMKTLITWKANPGRLRVVDVTCGYRYIAARNHVSY